MYSQHKYCKRHFLCSRRNQGCPNVAQGLNGDPGNSFCWLQAEAFHLVNTHEQIWPSFQVLQFCMIIVSQSTFQSEPKSENGF